MRRLRRAGGKVRAGACVALAGLLVAGVSCTNTSTGSTNVSLTIPDIPALTAVSSPTDESVPPSDGSAATDTSSIESAPTGAPAWAVDTAGCPDQAAVGAPITGTLTIGSVAPQSGGLVSAIYAPVVEGFRAYIDKANSESALGDVQLSLVVADDAGNAAYTPVAVQGLIAANASVVSGIIGSANNLAVRDLLNAQCVPQLMALANSPQLGDVGAAPWTLGGLVPSTVETTIYVNSIVRAIGEDGSVALVVTDDPAGTEYAESFAEAASDTTLQLVDTQRVPAANIEPPSQAILVMASERPQAVVASLAGAACATFLTELARARAATPDWNPLVYMSGGCADPSILALAGPAADGVMTSANLDPLQGDFVATMQARGMQNGFAPAAEGWTAAEVTVDILRAAQMSSAGLTRASIIDAARNLDVTPSLARPGVHYTTAGADDAFPAESLQIVRFEAATRSFVDVGPLIAQFES